ncbi:MAG: diguanylate cyclase [Clostridia bacterium]|nr:diguanylate cyclase [Clostridia bacterium]
MKSIKTKLLIVVIVAVLVTSVTLGAVSFITMHKIMHADADEMLRARCHEEATIVNRVFRDMKKSVDMMQSYAESTLIDVADLQDEALRAAYTAKMEEMFLDIALNTEGVVTYYFRYAPELWGDYRAGFCFLKGVNEGEFIMTEATDLSLYQKHDREYVGWYYEPVNAKSAVWLDAGHVSNHGKRMVSYVAPFYVDGVLIGVVGMDADFSTLTNRIDSITLYKNGYAYLTDTNDDFLYCAPRALNSHASTDQPFTEAKTELINGMNLVVRANYADIQSESRPMLFNLLLFTGLLFALFALITVFVTNRIVNPLKRLTKMAVDIADGNIEETELICNSKDEIGTLSRIFKETSDKLREYMSHINALAYRDSLTGVKNRSAYVEASADVERTMHHSFLQFAVLMADINGLKQANDLYGHDMGNQLIISSARLLCDIFSQSPVFRVGGDEFVVILRDRDFEIYRELIEKLDAECATRYIEINDVKIPISIARGIAIYNPDIDQTFEDVVNHADHAMYLHKKKQKESQN